MIYQGAMISISLEGNLYSSTGGLMIKCQGGMCALIWHSGSGRILYINAENVQLICLSFRNGYIGSGGGGGAVYFAGSRNQIGD